MKAKPRKPKPKTPKVTTTGLPVLIPQPGGRGALLSGGTPGNAGGLGRPPSLIRQGLRGSYDQRRKFLDEVADGEVMQKAEIPLMAILPHVLCPKCGDKLEPKNAADLFTMTITGKVSASVKDRLASMDQMARYGLGPQSPLTVEAVTEKLRAQYDVLQKFLSPEVLTKLTPELKAVWTTPA